ncbi:alpha-glucosidase isoform X2 [Bemisia tabaci]|uniref:alpha-glucosidase isoform X2 n=1 Tax=Bemisia tabaci TaxID=7038 RepID=UPI003B27FD01
MAKIKFGTNAHTLDMYIRNMTDIFPARSYNWARDNHDNPRMTSQFYEESKDSWNMLLLLLPGVPTIYYGDELAMLDSNVRQDQEQDPQKKGSFRDKPRDGCRAPMLWDDTKNAGFTTAKKPWLPVHPNYYHTNVEAQRRDPDSHLNIFKRLVDLRRTPVYLHGDLQTFVPKEWVYMFTRSTKTETIAVLMNLGSETEEICARHSATHLPETMFVHTSSVNSRLKIGDKVKTTDVDETKCISMRPQSGLVLSTTSSDGVKISCSAIVLILVASFKVIL